MKTRLVVCCAAVAVLVGACSGGDLESLERVETATTSPSTEEDPASPAPDDDPDAQEPGSPEDGQPRDEDPFVKAGIDWPTVSPDDVEWAERPAAPAGFTDGQIDALAKPLQEWATRSALDAGVWDGSVKPRHVLAAIGPGSEFAAAAARRAPSPRLAVGNYFGEGVEVVGAPRMTSAWRTTTARSSHGPVLRLWLQTRTAYQVRRGDRTTVVGVVREHALGATRTSGPNGRFSVAGWYEFGAEGCPLVTQDALVPAKRTSSLGSFVELGSSDRYVQPRLDATQEVDAHYAERCGVKAGQDSRGTAQK